jgi:hypothetical protein
MGWQRFTVEETQDPFHPGEDTYVVIDAKTGDILFQCDDEGACQVWRDKRAEQNTGLDRMAH